jgi:ABC-type antimicrobial peptide transport system permease subunit
MKHYLLKTITRSILYNRKDAVYQIVIVALLSAVITGSLFTGYSVRSTLKRTGSEKLGNTNVIISSGLRYFDANLTGKIVSATGKKAVSILEADGYCQNFSTGKTALNIKIFGIWNDFFRFNSVDSVYIQPGTIAINSQLAKQLEINPGDEIIVHFKNIDPIPANAPFAPSEKYMGSKVLKVSKILTPQQMGNFSLGISQIIPVNIFMNISDIFSDSNKGHKANRLLIQNSDINSVSDVLSRILSPSDVGLSLRRSEKTGEPELISDRIFIDSTIVTGIIKKIPSASPVITYLGNSFTLKNKCTPYTFISALPAVFIPDLEDDGIIINRWLADDLAAKKRDSLTITWYDPGFGKVLKEISKCFIISSIVNNDSKYSDPSLMPDFPGISGSTTCSDWDAGVPILMDRIREKDENYWNEFKGTPKAFISYNTGKKIWGNNFGTATAIRFPQSMQLPDIEEQLTGLFDPVTTGFTVSDIKKSANNAAVGGVDFSVLFLSLSFFIIISCMILLSMAISLFFDSRRSQIRTYYALGFRNRVTEKQLFLEIIILAGTGALFGVFLGYLVNTLIIRALNTVWNGAVQTNSLSSEFSIVQLLYGFLLTLLITSLLILFKVKMFLKNLSKPKTGELITHSVQKNNIPLLFTSIITVAAIIFSVILHDYSTLLSFIGGSFLFATMILVLRYYFIRKDGSVKAADNYKTNYSKRFYFFHPEHAIVPVIFIAAGIFAIIITGANRLIITDKMLLPSGGTGGYLLWAESAIPVKEDLNAAKGKTEFGFDEEELKDLEFVQAKRLSGDDASCLNLNYVAVPSVLGIDPSDFIKRGSFSFASKIKIPANKNPWSLLDELPVNNTIYGIADQTVLQWGLKLKIGDTIFFRTENQGLLNIIICGGLKSSVFQGYLLVGENNFMRYFPSVPGSSIFLIAGKPVLSELYLNTLNERLSEYGFSSETAAEKLASFFQVENTYLNVFTVLGVFGIVLGVIGLGFVLIRNFNLRKSEFALMMATGYTQNKIRTLILGDHILILFWGIFTGTFAGLIATLPSIKGNYEMPWSILVLIIIAIAAIGSASVFLSVRSVRGSSLISQLRKE